MLALSDGHRRKSNFHLLRFIFFSLFLVIYQIISLMHQTMPPLIGIFFAFIVFLKFKSENTTSELDYRWYFAVLYLMMIEQIHGFITFSILITYILFYYFIFDWMLRSFKFRNLLIVLCIISAYFGIFWMNIFLAYIYKLSYLKFTYEYFVYTIVESIIALIVFRGENLCD